MCLDTLDLAVGVSSASCRLMVGQGHSSCGQSDRDGHVPTTQAWALSLESLSGKIVLLFHLCAVSDLVRHFF